MGMCISCLQRTAGTEKSRVLCKPCEIEADKAVKMFRKQTKQAAIDKQLIVSNR